jgi:multiple sugar transport system permease protein
MVIIPFYWMILTSIKSEELIANELVPSVWVKFKDMKWVNYKTVLTDPNFKVIRFMGNTLLVAFLSTVGTLVTTVLAAFAFARLNFRGRDALFFCFLATMMIPGEMFVITNYITVTQRFGWGAEEQTFVTAMLALTTPFMTSVFYIFFLRQTFKSIPDELYLAAKVDGTSDFKYLWRIMVPVASPTIITITILNAMGTWSAYIWPTLVANEEFRLITSGLREYSASFGERPEFTLVMAASVMVTAPLLVVFMFLKKYIMRGVSRSGIKG